MGGGGGLAAPGGDGRKIARERRVAFITGGARPEMLSKALAGWGLARLGCCSETIPRR